jgi:very-short-patch-repair endonuclease
MLINRNKKKKINKLTKFNGTSNLETKFKYILESMKIRFKPQYPFKGKLYDFYLPDHKILIEVDGDFFHVNTSAGYKPKYNFQKNNIKNDLYKNKLVDDAKGYKLLRFWESEINTDTDKIKSEIKKAILS